MSLYDSGVGRKPPLSSNQLPQPTAYTDYSNNNNEYPVTKQLASQPTNEVVIVHLIPNNTSTINQIGCIILSTDLHEKESFSFNFAVHDSFTPQADYIHSSLNNRVWIVMDDYPVAQILDNAFKALNKSPPQAQRIIDASLVFSSSAVFGSSRILASCNARIGCSEMYQTLQRIALHNLLSPPSSVNMNVSTQTMHTELTEAPLNDNTNEYSNTDILDDIINNEIIIEDEAPIMQEREEHKEEYDNEINGFHDESTAEEVESQSESEEDMILIQEMDNTEQRSVQEDSTKSEATMSQSPSLQEDKTKSSWAAKFKTKKTTSPKRRALGVVDHVSDNIYGAKQRGKYAATKSVDGIRNSIDAAIKKKDIIWVSYNGHQKPFIPRAIRPQSWDKQSFFAIQHKSKSQTKQRFYLKNVIEVRDKQWRISNVELEQLKKRNNAQYVRRGYHNKRPRPYNTNNQ